MTKLAPLSTALISVSDKTGVTEFAAALAARGVELFIRHRMDRWTGWLGYTLGWTSRTFAELNAGEAFVPKYDRRHDVNALVSYQAGRWKLAASFRNVHVYELVARLLGVRPAPNDGEASVTAPFFR